MEPHQSFMAEVMLLAVVLIMLVSRFWIIRHQQRELEDWARDIFFAASALLFLASTSCVAWYCWKSIEVYQLAAVVVDQQIAAHARNSTVDLTHMTAAQVAALQSQISEERKSKIELLATVMLLDSWYRRILFFMWGAYFTELWLLKGAFLAFYWRLFARVEWRYFYLLYGTTVVVVITYIIVLTIHFTWCTPVHRNWTIPLAEFPGTSSIDNLTTLTVGSFLNIATDLMILILPLLVIQSFKLRRREKWGLCFVFTMGIMCVTASVVRYYKMYLPFDHPPATMEGVHVTFLWSTIEVTTGFIAFCLPSLRLVLFRTVKRGRDMIRNKHRSAMPPAVAKGCSSGGYSSSKQPSTGSSGAKSKRKNLPRHPNSLLTADFVTVHRTMNQEDKGDATEWDSSVYSHGPNGIWVTNTTTTSTSAAGECDTTKQGPTSYRFPSPPTPSAATSTAKEHGEEYMLMPMERAYHPLATHTGSQENLRPAPRDGQYSAV